MTKSFLTESKKKAWLPRLINDQLGFVCYQCGETLKPGHYVFEHLDDKRERTRYEATALACVSCNNKKPHETDMQLKAQDLLRKKEEVGLKYLECETAHENNSSEIEINKTLFNFTKRYITEKITLEGKYSLDDAIAELPYLCQERFGHGSEATIRRYLKQLTSKVSEWQVIKDDKNKKWICKREVLN